MKIKAMLSLLLLCCLLLPACGEPAPVEQPPEAREAQETPAFQSAKQLSPLSDFPATAADMEVLLEELELDWTLVDQQEGKIQSSYTYSIEAPQAELRFEMGLSAEGKRFLQLYLTNKDKNRKEPLLSLERIAPQAFSLAEAIFGEGNQAGEIFAGLAESRPAEEWPYAFTWQNTAREGELFYTLDLRWRDRGYELEQLEIHNLSDYEDTQYFLITMRAAGRILVQEVPGEWDADRGYSNVNGRLSHFRPATELWPEAPAHWKAATLSDAEASVEVLLIPKGFTEEEWSVERKHLLEFRENIPYPLVSSSALLRPEDEIPPWEPSHSPQIDAATGAYIFPAYPGDESWEAFWDALPESSHPENAPLFLARQRMNVPEELLQEMSTDALVLTVRDYPLMTYAMDMNYVGDPRPMIDSLERFNAIPELFSRDGAREKLAAQLELLEAEYAADSSYDNLLRRNYIRGLLEELELRLEEAASAPEQP